MDFVISEISCHHALISLRSVVAVILAPVALAACSSVPDYANPVEWYKSTAEFVVGAEEGAEGEDELVEEAEAHGEGDFPALADTPNPEGRAPTVEEMEAVEEGLIADKEHARYTDEVIRRNSQEELIVAAAPPASLAAPSGKSPAPEVPREPPTVIPKPDFGPPPNTEIETQTPRQSPPPLAVTSQKPKATPQPMTFAVAPTPPADAPVDAVSRVKSLFAASGASATITPDPNASRNLGDIAAASGIAPPPIGFNGASRPAISVRAGVITFRTGSATLPKGATKIVREAAKLHRERGGTVRVVGHSSSRTRELSLERHKLANFSISMDRATALADALVQAGVDPSVVFLSAVGDQKPIYHESMPSGQLKNQRTEIYLDY